MQLIYNDVDITNDIKIIKASIKDNCGGIADSVSVLLSDTEKLWRNWGPQKNDRLKLISNTFSSGVMFIDELELWKGNYSIKGISVPLNAKIIKSRFWENIRFKKVAQDIAEEIGLSVEFYNVTDWGYERLEQVEKSNLEFLKERCILEGYNLKISDNKIVIYDEKTLENEAAVKTFSELDFIGEYSFKSISTSLYSSAEIKYFTKENNLLEYRYVSKYNVFAPMLKINNIKAYNFAEAERYCMNLLRYSNKSEICGVFSTKLNTDIAAANVISINDLGTFNGGYFIESLKQDLTSDKTYFTVRKIMEGY